MKPKTFAYLSTVTGAVLYIRQGIALSTNVRMVQSAHPNSPAVLYLYEGQKLIATFHLNDTVTYMFEE